MKSPGGGPALLFENGRARPCRSPSTSRLRATHGLGPRVQHLDELSDKIRTLLDVAKGPPSGWIDRFRLLGNLAQSPAPSPSW